MLVLKLGSTEQDCLTVLKYGKCRREKHMKTEIDLDPYNQY